jgi:hypothetical protein
MNRLTHGLRSATVTIPGEDLSEWQQFRDRIVKSLAPGDPLEEELAHRVAVCLWRARRCGALETIHASIEESLANAPFASDRNDIEDAEREVESAEQSLGWNQTALDALAGPSPLTGLTDMPDAEHLSGDRVGDMFREFTDVGYTGFDYHRRKFLLAAGLPESATKEPFEWDGRTAGLVRKALGILAKNQSLDMAEVVSEAMTGRAERRRSAKASVAAGERAVERAQEGVRLVEARRQLAALLPTNEVIGLLHRYEGHHFRQMTEAVNILQRLQRAKIARSGPDSESADDSE